MRFTLSCFLFNCNLECGARLVRSTNIKIEQITYGTHTSMYTALELTTPLFN